MRYVGSVGHVYMDKEQRGYVLEWCFYAPNEDEEKLPSSLEDRAEKRVL